jgi:RimJ/RimL family protein N-acetyltransferase
MSNWLNETELTGKLVKLVPLKREHRNDLVKAAADGNLWDLWFTGVPSEKTIDTYIDFAFSEKEQDRSLAFAVVDLQTNNIIGSTRYCNATPNHKRLEIGYTWYSKTYQKTGVNTECKFLLLSYAFEKLECIAVEFRTNWHNMNSRNAIARLGAKQDGVLRNHSFNTDGTIRDTVVFSIVREEWLAVKKSLQFRME